MTTPKIDVAAALKAAKQKADDARQTAAEFAPKLALENRVADPLADVPYDDLGMEQQPVAELSALAEAFKKRAQDEQARFTLATDTEFWFAVCFKSREQKEAFLLAMNWLMSGDKYIDGTKLARAMGITLPEVTLINATRKPKNKKLLSLT